jgi:phage-related protein
VRVANNAVVIDTELRIDQAKKEISNLESYIKNLEATKERMDRIFSTSKEIGIAPSQDDLKYYDTLVSEIDRAKNNISGLNAEIQSLENSKNGMEDKANSIKNIRDASEKASKFIRKMGDSAKKSSGGFKVGLKTMLKYVFGVQSLIALINKLRSAMVEGLKNLAQFNDGVNPTNTALSNLKSALTQLKNSFAVAFAPILTVIEPILTRLISLLSTAMNYVGQFFAALTGASTFTKAIKVQENYAKSLNGTAAAAKKAKGSLASIDELNNQSKQDNSGAGGTVSPNDMFEVAPIESKIAGLASKLKSILDPIKESLQNWFKNIDFQPLIDSFEKLKTAIEPLTDNIGKGLLWLLENVLEPLGSFVIEDALPAFFNLLASAVEACNKAFEVISPYLNEIWNEVFAPFAAFLGETFVGILNDVSQFFSEMGDMFVEKSEEIGTIFEFLKTVLDLVSIKWKVCIQAMSGQLKPFLTMVKNIISHVIDILSGLIKFITGVFTGNWKQAWEGVKDVLKGILNVIIDIVEGNINRIIGALNAISFDIPDIVPGIGGKHIGFNITPVSLPRLATGTVVPRQSREFAAIPGDNNRETEVVSPQSTMKQAMVEALQESGYYRQGESGDIVINIDGWEVFRVVKKQNDSYIQRTGRSAFQY